MTSKHQLVEICNRLCVLLDLLFGVRIENCEAGIDVPFLRVDAESQVDLDILDATDIPGYLPGELLVGVPGFSHAEKGCMSNSLGVGSDAVMLAGGEVDMFGTQAGEDMLDFVEACLGGTVFD